MLRGFLTLFALLFAFNFAHAVQPDELLKDPALEARARTISAGLRCLVCQNQSIDESDASVAKDLRVLVRDHLTQGKTDAEIIDYIVSRYGDYVLLKPRFSPSNYLLWATPFALVLAGIILAYRRPRKTSPESDALTAAEKTELEALLRK